MASRQSNSDLDRDADEIGKGNRASTLLRALDPFIKEHEQDLLQSLSISHEKLTDGELRSRVGELVGMRRFRTKLSTAKQRGDIARERASGN